MIHWTQLVNGLILAVAIYFAVRLMRNIYNIATEMMTISKDRKKVQQNHCKKPHEYIKVYVASASKECNACTKCGYCSEIDNYLQVTQLKFIKEQRKAHQDYLNWIEKQTEELSLELELGFSDTEKIVSRVMAFRRDYQVYYIEKQIGKESNE